ncbi:MAG: alpha/beta hydrolase [Prevotellaceae bacterium]|jgi:pimeloyl-ACP methyl ester carboxylesterase|nr:alpha/beta hydrolase [Prevotellaceae bacterium]
MTIQLDDVQIHCQTAGDNLTQTVVLLHGNGEDLHIFESQIRIISEFYRVVAIDTRGHGLSTRGTAPFCFHTFALDLIAVLDTLHIAKAHIVGFSDGAITALHTALLAQERVLSMVLLGVNYNPKGIRLTPRILIILSYIWLALCSLFSAKKRKRKEVWGLMVFQPNLTISDITQITIPTLVVTGQKDMASQRQNDEICSAIKGSKRLIIENGDHFWWCKEPERLNRVVLDFLSAKGLIKKELGSYKR